MSKSNINNTRSSPVRNPIHAGGRHFSQNSKFADKSRYTYIRASPMPLPYVCPLGRKVVVESSASGRPPGALTTPRVRRLEPAVLCRRPTAVFYRRGPAYALTWLRRASCGLQNPHGPETRARWPGQIPGLQPVYFTGPVITLRTAILTT
jgi:hypothetical protein